MMVRGTRKGEVDKTASFQDYITTVCLWNQLGQHAIAIRIPKSTSNYFNQNTSLWNSFLQKIVRLAKLTLVSEGWSRSSRSTCPLPPQITRDRLPHAVPHVSKQFRLRSCWPPKLHAGWDGLWACNLWGEGTGGSRRSRSSFTYQG